MSEKCVKAYQILRAVGSRLSSRCARVAQRVTHQSKGDSRLAAAMAANLAAQLAALGAPSSGQGQGNSGGGAPAARLPPKKRHRDVAAAPNASGCNAVRVDSFFRPGNDGACTRRERTPTPPRWRRPPVRLCFARPPARRVACSHAAHVACTRCVRAARCRPQRRRWRRVLLQWRATSAPLGEALTAAPSLRPPHRLLACAAGRGAGVLQTVFQHPSSRRANALAQRPPLQTYTFVFS
jgi:hypothetical protein